jgi:hypothetical protein
MNRWAIIIVGFADFCSKADRLRESALQPGSALLVFAALITYDP